MAIYRNIQMTFWTDSKVVDDFTPEDRYFYLYLMTNPHTNLAGCYELSIKQASDETGYSKDVVMNLLHRFEETHNVIRYSKDTKEVLLINWWKFNWTKSPKLQKSLNHDISRIKDAEFKRFVKALSDGDDTVSIPYGYGMDTQFYSYSTDTDTDCNTDTDNAKFMASVKEIVSYLNETVGTNYKPASGYIQTLIHARMADKFTVDDFKTVIWKKTREWKGTDMEKYLRPQTLFGTKFESYLNQIGDVGQHDAIDDFLKGEDNDETGIW